jgi:hypothetical protein
VVQGGRRSGRGGGHVSTLPPVERVKQC